MDSEPEEGGVSSASSAGAGGGSGLRVPGGDPAAHPVESAEERAFWGRYERALRMAGVEERVWLWYRRHIERFIRFLKPRRLREAQASDVGEFLVRMHRHPDVETWHVRQADRALRILYQSVVKSGWAAEWE